jgi:prevent-host-death family protein
MKTMAAADANRQFSAVLREVARGEQILVVSRGKPVAKIIPVEAMAGEREAARTALLARLQRQAPSGHRGWTRDELYD